jgi:hypothetical protein
MHLAIKINKMTLVILVFQMLGKGNNKIMIGLDSIILEILIPLKIQMRLKKTQISLSSTGTELTN